MKRRRGRVQAYLDGELSEAEGREIETEAGGGGAADPEEALRRTVQVRGAIASEPIPAVDTAKALEEVVRRLAQRRDGGDSPVRIHSSGKPRTRNVRLAWAASVTLLLGSAAAVAAIPGSPIRAWLEGVMGGSTVEVRTGAESAPPSAAARIVPVVDRFTVSVVSLPPSAEVHVRLVSGERLSIDAPAGSSFTSGRERIDVRPTPGIVRVNLPRDLPHAILRIEDRIVLERRGTEVRTPDDRVEERGDTWVIRRSGA